MVYSGRKMDRRDFLKVVGYTTGALGFLGGCIPVFDNSRQKGAVRVETPLLEGGRVVGTNREGMSLEDFIGQISRQEFRGYATYSGFPGSTAFISIYSLLTNPGEVDSQRFGNGYSLSHDPNRRIIEGRTGVFNTPIGGEEIAEGLVSKAVLVPVYPDELKIVALPLVNNLGIEDVASGFEGQLPDLSYSFSVPIVGEREEAEEGQDSGGEEGGGPPGKYERGRVVLR